jgi:hypothetical protein
MVDVVIFIEGGVLLNDDVSVQTLDNSQKFRESFYNVFYKLIDKQAFNINIQLGSGYKQAIKFFKTQLDKNSVLLIDLDNSIAYRDKRLLELELENYRDRVFFMIQEMEAWILSQPQKIDVCYRNNYKRERSTLNISDDTLLKGIHPEEIIKPSWVLKVLLKRYFSYEKRGKIKKKEYGKLKDAPDLLNLLDASKLHDVFIDVKRLINVMRNME